MILAESSKVGWDQCQDTNNNNWIERLENQHYALSQWSSWNRVVQKPENNEAMWRVNLTRSLTKSHWKIFADFLGSQMLFLVILRTAACGILKKQSRNMTESLKSSLRSFYKCEISHLSLHIQGKEINPKTFTLLNFTTKRQTKL